MAETRVVVYFQAAGKTWSYKYAFYAIARVIQVLIPHGY